jgi:hypothetical protein
MSKCDGPLTADTWHKCVRGNYDAIPMSAADIRRRRLEGFRMHVAIHASNVDANVEVLQRNIEKAILDSINGTFLYGAPHIEPETDESLRHRTSEWARFYDYTRLDDIKVVSGALLDSLARRYGLLRAGV